MKNRRRVLLAGVTLKGIVSKRLSTPYRAGPSRDWLNMKSGNPPMHFIQQP
jgi:ATP-dependent DNA ligase